MEWIRETKKGAVLSVRVIPRALKDKIQGVHAGALKIRLQAPPLEGKANQALIGFLSWKLDVPRARISILKGDTARNKTVLISGVKKEALLQKIESLSCPSS